MEENFNSLGVHAQEQDNALKGVEKNREFVVFCA